MFTGIINQVCVVKSFSTTTAGAVLTVDLQKLSPQVKTGDSIAINGVCLTVSKLAGSAAAFDLSGETLSKTNLGKLTAGSNVNTEPALKADDRFGGHFVLGHVDGVATVEKIQKKGDFATINFTTSKDLLEQMVLKGSVAVDGISLTIAELDNDNFTVVFIPQTLKETTLGKAKIGQKVNVETDIIGKMVKRHLEGIGLAKERLTVDKLKEMGF